MPDTMRPNKRGAPLARFIRSREKNLRTSKDISRKGAKGAKKAKQFGLASLSALASLREIVFFTGSFVMGNLALCATIHCTVDGCDDRKRIEE